MASAAPTAAAQLRERLPDVGRAAARLREEVSRRIVGLEETVEQVLIAIFSEHHALLEGVPGLAKTMLISSVAGLLDCEFRRIQFTPDLLPSDVTGTEVLAQDAGGTREFRFLPGPIFAHVILADEINRSPPKTQAALMEAMEERQVTSLGVRRPLERPFFVLATQNPIEQQGTYPLPGRSWIGSCSRSGSVPDPRRRGADRATDDGAGAAHVDAGHEGGLVAFQMAVAYAGVPPALLRYAVDLVRASRPPISGTAGARLRDVVSVRGRPRRSCPGQARRSFGTGDSDVRRREGLGPAVFRHRLVCSYAADADGSPLTTSRRPSEHVPYPGRSEARGEPAGGPRWRALMSLSGRTRSPANRDRGGGARAARRYPAWMPNRTVVACSSRWGCWPPGGEPGGWATVVSRLATGCGPTPVAGPACSGPPAEGRTPGRMPARSLRRSARSHGRGASSRAEVRDAAGKGVGGARVGALLFGGRLAQDEAVLGARRPTDRYVPPDRWTCPVSRLEGLIASRSSARRSYGPRARRCGAVDRAGRLDRVDLTLVPTGTAVARGDAGWSSCADASVSGGTRPEHTALGSRAAMPGTARLGASVAWSSASRGAVWAVVEVRHSPARVAGGRCDGGRAGALGDRP
jgi:MoxR-like ATPase